jgi:predicted nucleic acid-binding Zn ribbon protein
MKTPAPRAVGDLLTTALPQISDRLVELRIRHTWASIVGRDAARRARPDTLSGGTLRVVVDNSPWLHELTLRAGDLTTKVRERFPDVQTLRFVLGALEAEAAIASAKLPRAVPLTPADHADIDAAAAAIADSDLAAAARRLLVAARRFPRTNQGSRGAV